MAEISKEKLLWAYERMKLIRTFEDKSAELFGEGKLPGFVHLYAARRRSRWVSAPT